MSINELSKKLWTLAENILPFTFYRYLIFLRNKMKWGEKEWPYREEYFLKYRPFSKKKYYIARFEYPAYAYFAAAQHYVFVAEYARYNGMRPLMLLQVREDLRDRNLFGDNEWEVVFSQKKVSTILQQNATIMVSGADPYRLACLSKTCLDINKNPVDLSLHAKEDDWRSYYKNIHRYVKKYWKFNQYVMNETREEYDELFQHGNRILGVALRENFSEEFHMQIKNIDAKKTYQRHPLGPNVDEILDIVEDCLKKWNCDKIFVASVYNDSIKKFKVRFPGKVICCDRVRMTMSEAITEVNSRKRFIDSSLKSNHELRARNRSVGREYAIETLLLSKCSYFIGAKSGQTITALSLNGGRYKDIKILEDKNHIERY